jgi:hypothetical protein
MNVTVVAMSHSNWHGFVQFCQEYGLPNPLSATKDTRIDKKPSAYPSALSFDGDGISNLIERHKGFEHAFMTVICKLSKNLTLMEIATSRNMITTIVRPKERIVLVSASYDDWIANILDKLSEKRTDEIALFYTQVTLILETHGFRELFRQHPRTMDDGILHFI